jgi:hypothetical protein
VLAPSGNHRKDQVGQTAYGQAEARSRDAVCAEDLAQVRQAIQVAQTSSDAFPGSLSELKLAPNMLVCPIQPHEPYVYDAQTGQVHCPHPGHENY